VTRSKSYKVLLVGCLAAILLVTPLSAQKKLTTREANQHIGEHATVCGVVASAKYAASTRGQPTFLNLDEAYPNRIFTILIWGSDRPKFGRPEAAYTQKRVCATGVITEYRGTPEIIAHDPSQITVEK
jgi:hypothetical protein